MYEGEWIYVQWHDSYGVLSGWTELSDYDPKSLLVESVGMVIKDDDKVLALAQNYAAATENTPRQANGIMVIPKVAIARIIFLSSYLRPGSTPTQQQP